KRSMRQSGMKPYQPISASKMQKLMRKSTNATTTVAIGTIIRGKYTLLMSFSLYIRLLEASLNPVEKNVHGRTPANTMSAYGAWPSDGNLAILPKTMVNTNIVRK